METSAPRSYAIYSVFKIQRKKTGKDGFVLLTEIMFRISPQLDGPTIDLSKMILSFTLSSGTTYLSFHQEALSKLMKLIFIEIKLVLSCVLLKGMLISYVWFLH